MRRASAVSLVAVTLLSGLTTVGCTKYVTVGREPQAYYQTGPPIQDVSGALEGAFQAVKKIRVTGLYEEYRFSPESAPREGDDLDPGVLARAVDTASTTTTREASAVQIAQNNLRVTLLTNEHAVHFSDTIVEFSEVAGEGGATARRRPIHLISIKRNQYNQIVDLNGIHPFEVLARDIRADLALIGVLYPIDAESSLLATLPMDTGNSERLSWGSYVYVLGHPGGYPVVTRGIVSDPGREASSSFLIDGLWNEGISGGPILAIRGDDGRLEWVGIARAAAGRTEHRLVPDPDMIQEDEKRLPYEGRIYLEEYQRILYGISLSVPMTTIRRFIGRNRSDLTRSGWALPAL